MEEKVYCAHDQHDGVILSGISDCNGQYCYFTRMFKNKNDLYSEIYELTILNNEIFNLEIQNWEYWLFWLDNHVSLDIRYKIPHPVNYARIRKTKEFDTKIFPNTEIALRAENYYQNRIIIDEFLKSHIPTIYAEAVFIGDRDGIDTKVEWTIVDKPKMNASS